MTLEEARQHIWTARDEWIECRRPVDAGGWQHSADFKVRDWQQAEAIVNHHNAVVANSILAAESDLLAIAEALDMVNRPEGQGGYQRATAAEMVAAIRGMRRE